MLKKTTSNAQSVLKKAIQKTQPKMRVGELNTILSLATGTAEVSGLNKAKINELLMFKNGVIGMVHTLKPNSAGVIFLTNADSFMAVKTESFLFFFCLGSIRIIP